MTHDLYIVNRIIKICYLQKNWISGPWTPFIIHSYLSDSWYIYTMNLCMQATCVMNVYVIFLYVALSSWYAVHRVSIYALSIATCIIRRNIPKIRLIHWKGFRLRACGAESVLEISYVQTLGLPEWTSVFNTYNAILDHSIGVCSISCVFGLNASLIFLCDFMTNCLSNLIV